MLEGKQGDWTPVMLACKLAIQQAGQREIVLACKPDIVLTVEA